MKISGVYKITNTVTNDCYIGSSKDVKHRWAVHKCPSEWKKQPNNPLYLDMQKYGVDKFEFQILEEVESKHLKEAEQEFIEMLQPTYNKRRAKGWDIGKQKKYMKKYMKKYHQTKEYKEYLKKYQQSDKGKETIKKVKKKYQQSDKGKKYHKDYRNQICSYKGEILTLNALVLRFYKSGIEHPTLEAKKYLLDK